MAAPSHTGQGSAPWVEALEGGFDLLALHRHHPERYPQLLESAASGTEQGRFDILFAFPGSTVELRDGKLSTDSLPVHAAEDDRFLDTLDRWFDAESAPDAGDARLPFTGGWFLYLGYETAAEIEPVLTLPRFAEDFPTAFATRFPAAVIRDHARDRVYLVGEAGREDLAPLMRDDIRRMDREAAGGRLPGFHLREDDPRHHLAAVRRVRDYIHDGHVFQANLSRAWHGEADGDLDPIALYARLRETNPGPFAALVTHSRGNVISSSPERLVSRRDGWLDTRPIAGTRPRGRSAAEDERLVQELLGHPKERAEHVMLIDLERNDLGRVCRPGSVEVSELMVLESYRHVHHIVSNVRGKARADVTPGEVLRAVFPGGTITGCPKVRCMEILAELEQTGRGPYTGSVGYLNRDGTMDTNILIRTLFAHDRRLTFRAGGGVVADSDPERELAETRAKARGLVQALEGEGAAK